MSNPTLPSLDLTAEAFDAQHNDALVVLKENYDRNGTLLGPLPTTRIARDSTAEYGNLVDGLLRVTQRRLSGRAVNAREHGIVADGVTTETARLQAAIDAARAAGAALFLPMGAIVCDAELDISGAEIVGAPGAVLDFTGAAPANFPNNACLFAAGDLMQLPALAADVAALTTTVTFAAAPELAPGDVFAIYNPADGSFNAARPQYRAGEWCRVVAVAGAVVTLAAPLRAGYAAADVGTYRLAPTTVQLEGVEVRGLGTTDAVAVVEVSRAVDCSFARLRLSGTQWAHLLVDRTVGAVVHDVRAFDDGPVGATNYGIAIDSSSEVLVSGCRAQVRRHAVTLNQRDVVCGVPCRKVIVDGSFLTGTDHTALDAHGGCEDYWFTNNVCCGGITAGGDRGTISKCYASGSATSSGSAVRFTETIGADFTLADCAIEETVPLGSNRGLVDWGGNTQDALVVAERAGSRFEIVRNRIRLAAGLNAMILRHRGNATADVRATVAGNIVRRPTAGQVSAYMQVRGDDTSGGRWRQVVFAANDCDGVGIMVDGTGAESIQVDGDQVLNAGAEGIRVTDSGTAADFPWGGANGDQSIAIRGAQVRASWETGIHVRGWHADVGHLLLHDAESINNSRVGSGSAVLRSSCYVQDLEVAKVRGCTFGDGQSATTQVRTWAADNVGLLVESDNTVVGAPQTSDFTNIGRHVSRIRRLGSGGTRYNVEGYAAAIPTTGTWQLGDLLWNESPSVGNPVGWICTTTGGPGVFVFTAMANL